MMLTLAFFAAALVAPGFQAPAMPAYFAAGGAVQPAAAAASEPENRAGFQQCGYEIVAEYPHDRTAFTQGLFWHEGHLYEGTGQYGQSRVSRVALDSGEPLKTQPLSDQHFGEGITRWRDQIIGVTWRSGTGYRWRLKDLKPIGQFRYEGEGWGVTMVGDSLALSDGTSTLRFFDPATMTEQRRVQVSLGGRPLTMINELETIEGKIWANVWMSDVVVRIDPATGDVDQLINFTGLRAKAGALGHDMVLNGIAWDAAQKRLFVTGKNWPKLYQVSVKDCR
jgi:glutamine cyclotransferase